MDRNHHQPPPWSISEQISELRESRAVLREQVKTVKEDVDRLTEVVATLSQSVQNLNSTIDKSKGALWVIGSLSTGFGGIAGALVATFMHKGG